MRAGGAGSGLILLALLAGCSGEPPVESGEPERRDIVGGVSESGFPVVGALVADHGGGAGSVFCSAAAVTPTVAITAAHCLDAFDD